ncbi:anti-sigma factor [Sphingobacterium olei]|nr:anti-sigma factor [Sphingobacterium olei]
MDIKEYISSGIIEAYVMGLATEEEVSILECVRKNNLEVEQAILEAQKTLEDFASVHAIPPPTEVKDLIWNKISQQPAAEIPEAAASFSPDDKPAVEDAAVPVRSLTTRNFAIAASLLCALSIGANIYLQQENRRRDIAISELATANETTLLALQSLQNKWKLLQDPAIKTITLAGVEQHPDLKAHVFWNTKTTEVYLSMENLPAAPEGMQYQLWAIVDGTPVDAGVFPLEDIGEINAMHRIEKAQTFAITLEKEGGNPTPTLSQLYVIGNI